MSSTGVVDPRVDAAEARERVLGDAPHVVLIAHVRDDVDGLAALQVYLFDEVAERLFGARCDDELRAPPRGLARRDEPDAARRAGDYKNLLAQLLKLHFHPRSSPLCVWKIGLLKNLRARLEEGTP